MKILKSIGIGFVAFIVAIILFGITGNDSSGTDNVSLGFAIVVAIVAYLRMNKPIEVIAETVSNYQSTKEALQAKVSTDDSSLYAIAEKEILEDKADLGLWSQALVEAGGKEELRKVEYMKLRVRQLKNNAKAE